MSNQFNKNYYYGKIYRDYDSFMDHKSYAKKLVANYTFQSFLDIGCGCGNLVKEVKRLLEKKYKKECNVYGVDISKFAVKKANTRYIQLGTCKSLNFQDKEFEFVHILGTFSYLEKNEINQVIKEASRVSAKYILFDDVYRPITKNHDDFDPYRKFILRQKEWLNLWQKNLNNYNFQINGDEILIKKS